MSVCAHQLHQLQEDVLFWVPFLVILIPTVLLGVGCIARVIVALCMPDAKESGLDHTWTCFQDLKGGRFPLDRGIWHPTVLFSNKNYVEHIWK